MCLTTVNDTITCPQITNMTLEELTTLDKLNDAFYDCSKISWWKEGTQRYKVNLLINNTKLQSDVRNHRYKVSLTTKFQINERGKPRDIEAPAKRDRVLQKVLCKYILIPYITKPLIYDNYASIKNRGTSFARKRVDILLRRFVNQYGGDGYVVQIDIRKYFENIDHDILKNMIHPYIKEPPEIIKLVDYMVDTSSNSNKGLNLGAEAPQIFAIFYLNQMDQYFKTVLGVKFYGRYVDDIIIFAKTKMEAKFYLQEAEKQLTLLKLEINKKKTHITKLSHGFTFLQIKYHVDGKKIIKRPTHNKIVRERRRLKKYKEKYENGLLTEFDIHNYYKSWRNAIVKDCKHSKRTIKSMDLLYKNLFPVHEERIKLTRSDLIEKLYLEDSYGS